MKKITLFISMITLCVGFLSTASAQAPATGSAAASATIITPIAISSSVPMNFGSFSTSAAGGTLVLNTLGSRTAANGVKLIAATTGSPTAAQFTVTGETDYAYTIDLPSTDIVLTTAAIGAGTKTMNINTFTRAFTAGIESTASGALASGTQNFFVGATLVVGGSQAVGLYTTATPFNVTVNYN